MRLERARFYKYGPFDDFTLDLVALGPDAKLVAVVAPNGSGKTCALETAVLGACYRKMPTQGTLKGRARARDSFVETTIVNGKRYEIRHDLDALGKGETTLTVDGVAPYKGTSVKTFDKYAAEHFPDEDVLTATQFAVQGSGGFLELGSAERISVILRACGVERIERMAEQARKRAAQTLIVVDGLKARIGDARGGAVELSVAADAVFHARADARDADERLERARSAVANAQAEDKRLAELRQVANAARTRRAEKLAAFERARLAVSDLGDRVANNRAVLADADAIRKAVADVERLTAELNEKRAAADQADSDARHAAETGTFHKSRVEKLAGDIERAREFLASRAAIDAAVAALPSAEAASNEAAGAVGVAEDALTDLQGQHVAGADDRIKGLRDGFDLLRIEARREPTNVEDFAEMVAGEADRRLGNDDQAVALATELPAQLRQAQEAVRAARQRKAETDRNLSSTRAAAERASLLQATEQSLERLRLEHDAAEYERSQAGVREHAAAAAAVAFRRAVLEREPSLAAAKPLAAKAEPLARAEARLTELEPQLAAAREALSTAEAELAGAPEPAPVPDGPALAPLDRGARDAEADARNAAAAVARAEAALEQARTAAERVAELGAELVTAEGELADWNRLALDCGRDGIQSAEVDSAGPELTELANDLLHNCFGTRFTVSIETQRSRADGKGLVEECRVVVLDTVEGREDEARHFSGGERVILSEAVSLALTMLACRRSGLEGVTLIRDESSAALDPVNARAWVAMLRRAVELVRADRLLFVSHSPEVQDLADARIEVG